MSSSFFEQSNFEQLIMSRLYFLPKKFNVIAKMPFLISYLLKIYFFQGQKSEIFIIFGLFFVKCTYLIPWLTNKHSIKNFFPPKNTGTNNTLQVTAKKPICRTDKDTFSVNSSIINFTCSDFLGNIKLKIFSKIKLTQLKKMA